MPIWRSNPLKMTSSEARSEVRVRAAEKRRLEAAYTRLEKAGTRQRRNLNAALGFTGSTFAGSLLVALSTLPSSVQEPTAQVSKQTNQFQLSQTEPNKIDFGNSGSPRSQATLHTPNPALPSTQNPTPIQREAETTIKTLSMPIVRPQDNSSMPNARRSSN